MIYCRFQTASGAQYGEVCDRSGVSWIERLIPPPPEDPWCTLCMGLFEPLALASATLLTPVVPSKIVCIGRNYRDHAAELNNPVPREPLLFLKAPSSLIGPGQAIRLPTASQRVDFEGELAIVIGKTCTRLAEGEDVRPYIRGYTIVNDVTARDLQKSDGQWSRAKGFDSFCPAGPVVTDEIDPAAGIAIRTTLNGDLRQDGNTLDLIFPIDALLRYITAAMTLAPGDLIPTGTPAGVGPMKPGDLVAVSAQGIGTLRNPVEAA